MLLQSTVREQARSPVASAVRRSLNTRPNQLGPTSVHRVETEGSIGARTARAFDVMALVWPHGDERVIMLGTLISPALVSCRNSIRCRRHRA